MMKEGMARVSMSETRGFCTNWCPPADIAPISCSVVKYARVLVLAIFGVDGCEGDGWFRVEWPEYPI